MMCVDLNSETSQFCFCPRFDKVLCACGHMLNVLPLSSLPPFEAGLRLLCAQLYFMAGRYLYLLAQKNSVLGTSNTEFIVSEYNN